MTYELLPKKKLGQHFLNQPATIQKIISAINPTMNDIVIEIGPGPGTITGKIADLAKKLYAVDIDPDVLAYAQTHIQNSNITWLNTNILQTKISNIILEHELTPSNITIAGNLPYNISSQILFWIINERKWIDRAIIMLQKEVACRICAQPNSKSYGILSVALQLISKPKILFHISPNNFYPPPDVMSSLLSLDIQPTPFTIKYPDILFPLIRAAFSKRRKILKNTLSNNPHLIISLEDINTIFKQTNLDPQMRAEMLTPQNFLDLSNELFKTRRAY